MIKLSSEDKALIEWWLRHGVDPETGLCKFCANWGKQHIQETKSPAGNIIPAHTVFCICPNGRELNAVNSNGKGKHVSKKKK